MLGFKINLELFKVSENLSQINIPPQKCPISPETDKILTL